MEEVREINDLIFRELIKRGYSLEGNTRVWNIADSKLWYLTPEQAQSFLDLEQSESYQKEVIDKEIKLIEENVGEIIKMIGTNKLNIVDLGCGDGRKASIFIKQIGKDAQIRYCPVDISSYMVQKAIDRIKKMDVEEVVKFQWNISDFENLENVANLLRQNSDRPNLFLLLGNTLGNFEINELLYEIRSSMEEGDVLVIGNGLNAEMNHKKILEAYNNPMLDKMLYKTISQIGFLQEEIEYGARFRNSRVEMYYTIKKDKKINFLDKTVYFNSGDQIIIAISYKYNKTDFSELMKEYFGKNLIFTSPDEGYVLAICK